MLFNSIIQQLAGNIIQTVLCVVVSYIGIAGKRIYTKYINTETKQIIVKDCVKAAEQLYQDLHGDDKKAECENMIVNLLYEKGITITQQELDVMIEAAVQELNKIHRIK